MRVPKLSSWEADRWERQCEKYARKLRGGLSPARRDGDVKAQIEHFRTGSGRMAEMESMARQVLMSRGVMMVRFVPYLGFCRHVARLVRLHCGRTLQFETGAALEYWAGRGLDRQVLRDILFLVFNISEPLVRPPETGV